MSELPHGEFVEDYRAGRIRVHVDKARAASFVSRRLMLPFILLPVMGTAVALALTGNLTIGVALFLLALIIRYSVRASAHGFVLLRSLENAGVYRDAMRAGVIGVEEAKEERGGREA